MTTKITQDLLEESMPQVRTSQLPPLCFLERNIEEGLLYMDEVKKAVGSYIWLALLGFKYDLRGCCTSISHKLLH